MAAVCLTSSSFMALPAFLSEKYPAQTTRLSSKMSKTKLVQPLSPSFLTQALTMAAAICRNKLVNRKPARCSSCRQFAGRKLCLSHEIFCKHTQDSCLLYLFNSQLTAARSALQHAASRSQKGLLS